MNARTIARSLIVAVGMALLVQAQQEPGTWLDVTPVPSLPSAMWDLKPTDGEWTIGSGVISYATSTFDGTNRIIVTGNFTGGIWRYVEPAPATQAAPLKNATARKQGAQPRLVYAGFPSQQPLRRSGREFFDIRGQRIGEGNVSRQALIVR